MYDYANENQEKERELEGLSTSKYSIFQIVKP